MDGDVAGTLEADGCHQAAAARRQRQERAVHGSPVKRVTHDGSAVEGPGDRGDAVAVDPGGEARGGAGGGEADEDRVAGASSAFDQARVMDNLMSVSEGRGESLRQGSGRPRAYGTAAQLRQRVGADLSAGTVAEVAPDSYPVNRESSAARERHQSYLA